MAGWYVKRQGWAWRLGAGLSAAGLVAGLTVVMPPGQVSVAAARHPAPALPKVKAAAGVGVLHRRKIEIGNAAAARWRPLRTAWPSARQAGIALTAAPVPLTRAGQVAAGHSLLSPGVPVYAPGTPVWAQRAAPAGAGPATLGVRVLGHAAAMAAGVHGVVFTAAAAPGDRRGRVRLGISYAKFAQASGGNYGLDLGLAELPAWVAYSQICDDADFCLNRLTLVSQQFGPGLLPTRILGRWHETHNPIHPHGGRAGTRN